MHKSILFRFTIPEMASLSQEQRQSLLEMVWKSRAVLSAWNHYCTRPLVWPLVPVVPIAIYGAIEKISTGRLLLFALPIVCLGLFGLRQYYMQQFMSVFRSEVLARLPANTAPQANAG